MSMSINMNSLLIRSLYLASIPLIFLYLFVPALFFFFPSAMQHIFFLNFVRFRFVDYYDLASHGVRSRGRNFYLREKDVSTFKMIENAEEQNAQIVNAQPTIGVWHILPASISERFGKDGEKMDESAMERSLNEESHGVFIYLHGNSFDRTAETRCELYNVLSAMDFHVLAIDYRGYGDSTDHPSENGLNLDAHAIWKYAKKHAPNKDIYIWGHSMGTGVATRLAAELSDAGSPPKALVLEAPFNNLRDVVRNHPLSTPFRIMPWFDAAIVQPLIRSGLHMNSDERIQRVSCPILVLHAEDDHIIPIKLGKKLVESATSAGKKVTFIEFEGDREFLHKFIHRAQELPDVIREFLDKEQVDMRGRNRQQSEDQGIHVEEQT